MTPVPTPAFRTPTTGFLNAIGSLLVVTLAVTSAACASRGGVPLPFPGAAIPPGADAPPAAGTPVERAETPADALEPPAEPAAPLATAAVLATALAFQGSPYRNGGSDPSGFDCSGFVQYVFGRHSTPLPREVRDQYLIGREIPLADVRAGDLVFFETVSRGPSHVGMALGDGRFVHAPSSRGVVRVESYALPYWARRFVGARRVEPTIHTENRSLPGVVQASK